MVQPVRKPDEHYTYRDILSWPEGERWELIDGVPYDMTPAPSPKHQQISFNLSGDIRVLLLGHPCQGFSAPIDVFLAHDNQAGEDVDTIVQPDVIVVCDQTKITNNGIKGAPDLVVEILSPSTSLKDRNEKLRLYERSGVKEYWLVNPQDRTLTVFLLKDDGHYALPVTYGEQATVPLSVLEGLHIDLQRVFAGEA